MQVNNSTSDWTLRRDLPQLDTRYIVIHLNDVTK